MDTRTSHLTPRPGIMEISPYVGGRSALDGRQNVIRLASNESALGPSPQAVAAYEALSDSLHRYPDGSAADLRNALGALNGLDPDGVRWVRTLLRDLAARGRTVFVSSHLMHEMEETAQRVVVIGRGRLLAHVGVAELRERAGGVRVRPADPGATPGLARILRDAGATVDADGPVLEVRGVDAARVGVLACAHGVALGELTPHTGSLEDSFLALTREAA